MNIKDDIYKNLCKFWLLCLMLSLAFWFYLLLLFLATNLNALFKINNNSFNVFSWINLTETELKLDK